MLLERVLAALSEVHAAGLIHRDVKTGNVLLRATGTGPLHALLTDFGLAIGERDARFTELGTVIDTPGYLAPEILAGSAELSAAQDTPHGPNDDLLGSTQQVTRSLLGVGNDPEHRPAGGGLGSLPPADRQLATTRFVRRRTRY